MTGLLADAGLLDDDALAAAQAAYSRFPATPGFLSNAAALSMQLGRPGDTDRAP